MSIQGRRTDRRAFALIELAAVVLIVLVACLVATLLLPDTRRRASLAGSIQNLQQLGKAAAGFAADKENRVYSFDWTPGPHSCGDYTFPVATTRNDAAADQAVCILRHRTGRTDINAVRGWVPHILYSHLVLIDYLEDSLPSPMVVSPGDCPRLAMQRGVLEDPPVIGLPCAQAAGTQRFPYGSSYELQPSFYSPDALINNVPTVSQDPMGHRWYRVGNQATILGNRRMDEVRYPSHKAMIYETNQRFFGSRELFFMYPEARVPVLFADGGVSVRSGEQANLGYLPNTPISNATTIVNYTPELCWETPTNNGGVAELVEGRIRWTRSGLRGRDFMGPEVPWVP